MSQLNLNQQQQTSQNGLTKDEIQIITYGEDLFGECTVEISLVFHKEHLLSLPKDMQTDILDNMVNTLHKQYSDLGELDTYVRVYTSREFKPVEAKSEYDKRLTSLYKGEGNDLFDMF